MYTHIHTCTRTCSMVRGRLQRNYHVCIRRVTRPQAYWPCQHRLQAYRPCQYAPAQHHDRWPARDQGCHGRETPANRSSRSRHDDAEHSLRGKRSNRVVHGPVERTLSLSAGPKRFSSRGVLLVAVKPEGLAARREHCMSKLKYIRSSAKRF